MVYSLRVIAFTENAIICSFSPSITIDFGGRAGCFLGPSGASHNHYVLRRLNLDRKRQNFQKNFYPRCGGTKEPKTNATAKTRIRPLPLRFVVMILTSRSDDGVCCNMAAVRTGTVHRFHSYNCIICCAGFAAENVGSIMRVVVRNHQAVYYSPDNCFYQSAVAIYFYLRHSNLGKSCAPGKYHVYHIDISCTGSLL